MRQDARSQDSSGGRGGVLTRSRALQLLGRERGTAQADNRDGIASPAT
jgi:hypothetical protein